MKNKSITEDILGSSANVKILDCLMDGIGLDYAISDFAEMSNVSRQHTNKIINTLLKYGIVVATRITGRTQLYSINEDNAIAKKLLAFQDELLKYQTKRLKE